MRSNKVLLRHGTLIDLEPLKLETRDLLIVDGRVAVRDDSIRPDRSTKVVDCRGRFIMPGFVNAQSRLHLAQTVGMPTAPGGDDEVPTHHTPETIVTAAFAGGLDASRLGTTTIIDRHSSSSAVQGSLDLIRDVVLTIGLRSVLTYEVDSGAGTAIDENRRFSRENGTDKICGAVAIRDGHAIDDETLKAIAEAFGDTDHKVLTSLGRSTPNGNGGVTRLRELGLLGPRSVIADTGGWSAEDVDAVRQNNGWIVHCPSARARRGESNSPNSIGDFDAIGTDGISSDMFSEMRLAWFQNQERETAADAADIVRLVTGGHQLASELLGLELGSTRRDAGADFIILDYQPKTPIHVDNLAAHIVWGLGAQHVEATMIDGTFVYRHGRYPNVDVRKLGPLMQRGARDLWSSITGEESESAEETAEA